MAVYSWEKQSKSTVEMSDQLLYNFGEPTIRLRAFIYDAAQWLRAAA